MHEDLLLNWRDWGLPLDKKPSISGLLSKGLTNTSYLIESGTGKWVLRLNSENSRDLGIDRQRELAILKAAVAADLAPHIAYCSVQQGVLVTEFIEGDSWQLPDMHDRQKRTLLLNAFEKIHSLNVDCPEFSYMTHLLSYWEVIDRENIEISRAVGVERDFILARTQEIEPDRILCHHDPLPLNTIVSNDRLYFLDWEYAARGWLAFDYAALCTEWKLEIKNIPLASPIPEEEFELALKLYYHLCELWTCIRCHYQQS